MNAPLRSPESASVAMRAAMIRESLEENLAKIVILGDAGLLALDAENDHDLGRAFDFFVSDQKLRRSHRGGVEAVNEQPDRATVQRENLRAKYPAEFELGYRAGYTGQDIEPCDQAGYPTGFHTWDLMRRNAWWAGWNLGNVESQNE